MAELLFRLGRFAARRSWIVIAAWAVVLGLAAGSYAIGAGSLSGGVSIPGTPTAKVTDTLQAAFPQYAGGTGTIVLTTTDHQAFTATQKQAIAQRVTSLTAVAGVAGATDPFQAQAKLDAGQAQIDQARQQISQARTQLEQGQAQLAAAQAQLDAARAAAQQNGQSAAAAALDARQQSLDASSTQLTQQVAELEAKSAQVEANATMAAAASKVRLVSTDGTAALVPVSFTAAPFSIPAATLAAVQDTFASTPIDGVHVDFSQDLANGTPKVVGGGELTGLLVAGAVLVIMLGTLIGAGLPILMAVFGVGVATLGSLSLSGRVEMSSVTPALGLMLGLAVGIDYSLFIINRHRQQLKHGYEPQESIALANGTSGNAVVFAGATVVIALLALNVTGIGFLGLMGMVGAAAIIIAVAVAITLTPALLGLAGTRILSRRERRALAAGELVPPPTARRMRTRTAVGMALPALVALGVLALPATSLRLGLPDGGSTSPGSTTYAAYQTVATKFGPGVNGPLLVVAYLSGGQSQSDQLATQVAVTKALTAQQDVVAVAPIGVSSNGSVAAFQVIPAGGPNSTSTADLVHHLRDLSPPAGTTGLGVAGSASGNIDISDRLAGALPLYLALVVGLSLIILVLVFRSLFVPLIATAGFVMSYLATLGAVVAIFQWGWLASVFHVSGGGIVLNFLPTVLVGILFGLAMDYMLFIGSGMREAYVHGADSGSAVVLGLRAGRPVVTAAAIIMASVFGGFVFSDNASIRPIGFALAFGVLADAFVVRLVLVPALMHLVGDRAWWLPRWLDRILPNVDVEGAALERRHPHHELHPSEHPDVANPGLARP